MGFVYYLFLNIKKRMRKFIVVLSVFLINYHPFLNATKIDNGQDNLMLQETSSLGYPSPFDFSVIYGNLLNENSEGIINQENNEELTYITNEQSNNECAVNSEKQKSFMDLLQSNTLEENEMNQIDKYVFDVNYVFSDIPTAVEPSETAKPIEETHTDISVEDYPLKINMDFLKIPEELVHNDISSDPGDHSLSSRNLITLDVNHNTNVVKNTELPQMVNNDSFKNNLINEINQTYIPDLWNPNHTQPASFENVINIEPMQNSENEPLPVKNDNSNIIQAPLDDIQESTFVDSFSPSERIQADIAYPSTSKETSDSLVKNRKRRNSNTSEKIDSIECEIYSEDKGSIYNFSSKKKKKKGKSAVDALREEYEYAVQKNAENLIYVAEHLEFLNQFPKCFTTNKKKCFYDIIDNICNLNDINEQNKNRINDSFKKLLEISSKETKKQQQYYYYYTTKKKSFQFLLNIVNINADRFSSFDGYNSPKDFMKSAELLKLYLSFLLVQKDSDAETMKAELCARMKEKEKTLKLLSKSKCVYSRENIKSILEFLEFGVPFGTKKELLKLNLLRVVFFIMNYEHLRHHKDNYKYLETESLSIFNKFNQLYSNFTSLEIEVHEAAYKRQNLLKEYNEIQRNKQFSFELDYFINYVEMMLQEIEQSLLSECNNDNSLFYLINFGFGGLILFRLLIEPKDPVEAELCVEPIQTFYYSLGNLSLKLNLAMTPEYHEGTTQNSMFADEDSLNLITMYGYYQLTQCILFTMKKYLDYINEKINDEHPKNKRKREKYLCQEIISALTEIKSILMLSTNFLSSIHNNRIHIESIIKIYEQGQAVDAKVQELRDIFVKPPRNKPLSTPEILEYMKTFQEIFQMYENIFKECNTLATSNSQMS